MKLKTLFNNVSMFGPLSTFRWLIITAIKKIIRFDLIIITEKSLADPIGEIRPKLNVIHKLIDINQMHEISGGKYDFENEDRFSNVEKVYHEMRERFKDNQIVCISVVNNKIVSWKWVDFKRLYILENGMEIKLPTDYAYLFDSYTVPSYRGKRIQPSASEYLFNILKTHGIAVCIGYVMSDNMSSLSSLKTSGWKKMGYIYSTTLFKKNRTLSSNNIKKFITSNNFLISPIRSSKIIVSQPLHK